MLTLNPLDAAVKCETQFAGLHIVTDLIERQTKWTFRLSGFGFKIDTHIAPEDEEVEAGEVFAQALVAALGWKLPMAARSMHTQTA